MRPHRGIRLDRHVVRTAFHGALIECVADLDPRLIKGQVNLVVSRQADVSGRRTPLRPSEARKPRRTRCVPAYSVFLCFVAFRDGPLCTRVPNVTSTVRRTRQKTVARPPMIKRSSSP